MSNETAAAPVLPVWVERTGVRSFVGRNPRGAEVTVGSAADDGVHFTPGELAKVALAACSALTADGPLARHLGEDFELTVQASGAKDAESDSYLEYLEELRVDLSGLDEATRARVVAVVTRAIDAHCTVGRTIQQGAEVHLTITGER